VFGAPSTLSPVVGIWLSLGVCAQTCPATKSAPHPSDMAYKRTIEVFIDSSLNLKILVPIRLAGSYSIAVNLRYPSTFSLR
jgi:hypothetical protein